MLTLWQEELDHGWNALYWSNHDQPRAVTRFGDDGDYRELSAKMLGTLLHMMKGTPYIYQGEEIGMKNVPFDSIASYQDIETKYFYQTMREAKESDQFIKKAVYLKSRDNARTPMPWDHSLGYGFSTGKPWIDYSPDNAQITVSDALKDSTSVFYHYQRLIALRKEFPIIVHGRYQLIAADDSDIYAYIREYNDQKMLVICSFSPYTVNFVPPQEVEGIKGRLLLSNYEDSSKEWPDRTVSLRPYEALVYLSK